MTSPLVARAHVGLDLIESGCLTMQRAMPAVLIMTTANRPKQILDKAQTPTLQPSEEFSVFRDRGATRGGRRRD